MGRRDALRAARNARRNALWGGLWARRSLGLALERLSGVVLQRDLGRLWRPFLRRSGAPFGRAPHGTAFGSISGRSSGGGPERLATVGSRVVERTVRMVQQAP